MPIVDANHVAENVKTLKKLREYLCRAAVPPSGPVRVTVCEKCESQCAYGRQYLKLYRAEKDKKEEAPVKTSVDQKTAAEQLEEAITRREQAERCAAEMVEKCRELEKKIDEANQRAAEAQARYSRASYQLMRMKAKLYDMEHPEEDD